MWRPNLAFGAGAGAGVGTGALFFTVGVGPTV